MLRLGNFAAHSRANGPGLRSVVWLQGCSRSCPGCFNPYMQDVCGGRPYSTREVAQWIVDAGVGGVTLSGGEPFEQASEVARLVRVVREAGLSVICYSGYTYDEIIASTDKSVHELLNGCDVLIDGPFLRDLASPLPLRGSANQRVIRLTERYSDDDLVNTPTVGVSLTTHHATASGVGHESVLAEIRERLARDCGVAL